MFYLFFIRILFWIANLLQAAAFAVAGYTFLYPSRQLIIHALLFGKKKQVVHCAVCNKELGRHKYKPGDEWNIEGLLCADCHIEKTKEFLIKEQETPDRCAICNKELTADEDRNKPRWQWNMESGTLVCNSCFQKKDVDYNKRMNFCVMCNSTTIPSPLGR
jgi:hypothetical protein